MGSCPDDQSTFALSVEPAIAVPSIVAGPAGVGGTARGATCTLSCPLATAFANVSCIDRKLPGMFEYFVWKTALVLCIWMKPASPGCRPSAWKTGAQAARYEFKEQPLWFGMSAHWTAR